MLVSYIFYLLSIALNFGAVVRGAPAGARKDLIAQDGAQLMDHITSTKAPRMLNDRREDGLQPISRTLNDADHKATSNKAVGLFNRSESGLRNLAEAPRGQIDDAGVSEDLLKRLGKTFGDLLARTVTDLETHGFINESYIHRLRKILQKLGKRGADIMKRIKDSSKEFSEKMKESVQEVLERIEMGLE